MWSKKRENETLESPFWELSQILKLGHFDKYYIQIIFSINMKIHHLVSSISDFICIPEIADELDSASTPGAPYFFFFQ
jgi:hypothetical protein